MGLSHLLQTFHNGGSVARIIQPQVPNYKINRTSNTNYSNLSNNMRKAKRLYLSGSSQQANKISRFNNGNTQFGNYYLGIGTDLNYLGRRQGMPGGSGMPPKNILI